jgi:hypothetical protein
MTKWRSRKVGDVELVKIFDQIELRISLLHPESPTNRMHHWASTGPPPLINSPVSATPLRHSEDLSLSLSLLFPYRRQGGGEAVRQCPEEECPRKSARGRVPEESRKSGEGVCPSQRKNGLNVCR